LLHCLDCVLLCFGYDKLLYPKKDKFCVALLFICAHFGRAEILISFSA
jgi:hypothetical protein